MTVPSIAAWASVDGWHARPLAPVSQADLLQDVLRLGVDLSDAQRVAHQAGGMVVRVDALSLVEADSLVSRARDVGVAAVMGKSVHQAHACDVILAGAGDALAVLGPDVARAVEAATWRPGVLRLGDHELDLSQRVAVMGILNVTPDSFFDGGRHNDPEAAVAHALQLVEDGADVVDVGGDSAGGKAARIDAAEEIRRVVPVIRSLTRQSRVPIAVDTHRAATAEAALAVGAVMVNDITGFADPGMAPAVARAGAGACVMHIKGVPKEYPPDFHYATVPGDVAQTLQVRMALALDAGVRREGLVADPGIEFGKLVGQDLELLRRLPEITALGFPVLVAVSRKDFIGHALGGLPAAERLEGTAATVAFAVQRGARMVRVHDVRAMTRVCRMTEALLGWGWPPNDPRLRMRSDGVVMPADQASYAGE